MARTLGALGIALGSALALGVGAGLFVRQILYPSPAVRVGPPPEGYREVYWRLDDGTRLHGWHGGPRDAPDRGPVLLFFHGNGENLETLKWSGLFERFDRLGVHAVAVEYPGYGRSGGSPAEERLIAGALAALDWAAERFEDRPLVPAGWSLGAAVALQAAARRPEAADALVLMSPWTRLEDVGAAHFPRLVVRLLLRESYDSMAAAGAVRCPSLVIHGRDDRVIPARLGRELAGTLDAGWHELAGSGHNDLLARPETWERVAAFLQRLESAG